MILKIQEYCAWEREKWCYILDMGKQDAATLNMLMLFIRLANKEYDIIKEEAYKAPDPIPYHPIFNRHPVHVFAASRYSFDFYDSVNIEKKSVHNSESNLYLSGQSGYHNFTNIMLDRIILRR